MMKNNVFPVCLPVLMIAAFLCGCSGNVKSPGISFTSDKYNFGTIQEGTSVNHTFEFTNNGTGVLIVREIRPTCGCTVAGAYDKEVKPGQNGKIPVTLDTTGFEGYSAKSVIVKTNIPGNPDHVLTIEGTVTISVSVTPRVLSFGNIERDRTAPLEGKITIANRLPDPIRITDVVKAADDLTIPNVTVSNDNVETGIETLKDGFVYTLAVTVHPPFKHGEVMGTIVVKTDSRLLPEINTQFSYFMEPMVKVFPNPLFVSKDNIASGVEQLINVECEPGPDMRIAGLSVNIDKVGVSLKEVERGRKYAIQLKFPKDFTFDPANTLMVKFTAKNVPDEPVFGVPVLGI
ncbi:MAG: DUF1573 domain-containing protein [Spirochaetales bacterium]|nr:DUF1573 domain-containing protein [Spirochaetales bacterium]